MEGDNIIILFFNIVTSLIILYIFTRIKEASKNNDKRKVIVYIILCIVIFITLEGLKEYSKKSIRETAIASTKVSNTASSNSQFSSKAPVVVSKPEVAKYNNWIHADVEKIGYFQIPQTMELQSKQYRENMERIAKESGLPYFNTQKFITQQKGLNNRTQESLQTYARIILTSVSDQSGFKLGDILDLSPDDLKEFDQIVINNIKAEHATKLNGKLLKFQPTKIVTINGIDCLHYYYERSLNDAPYAKVYIYVFFNNDITHILEISYRNTESHIWEAQGQDLRNAVYTLKLNKR